MRRHFLTVLGGAELPPDDTNKRSVYLMTQRIQRHSYLAIFDGADPSTSTAARPDDPARLQLASELAFARPATPDETADAQQFLTAIRAKLRDTGTPADKLDAEAWQAMVRVLFRLNEFVYTARPHHL